MWTNTETIESTTTSSIYLLLQVHMSWMEVRTTELTVDRLKLFSASLHQQPADRGMFPRDSPGPWWRGCWAPTPWPSRAMCAKRDLRTLEAPHLANCLSEKALSAIRALGAKGGVIEANAPSFLPQGKSVSVFLHSIASLFGLYLWLAQDKARWSLKEEGPLVSWDHCFFSHHSWQRG